jgi:hypothetical protein
MERETHPLFTHFGDYTNRVLTAIDIFKGFTGVAYPMDIISRELIYTIQKWRTLPILPIDKLRGIVYFIIISYLFIYLFIYYYINLLFLFFNM